MSRIIPDSSAPSDGAIDATEAMADLAFAAEQVNINLDSVRHILSDVPKRLAELQRRRDAGESVARKEFREVLAEGRRAMRALQELISEADAIKRASDDLASAVQNSLSLPPNERN